MNIADVVMRPFGSAPLASSALHETRRVRSRRPLPPRPPRLSEPVPTPCRRDQSLEPGVDAAGRRVQRGDAVDRGHSDRRPARAGTARTRPAPLHDRIRQHVRAVGAGLVHAAPAAISSLGHLDVAVARREHQRREALGRRRRTSAPPSMSVRDDLAYGRCASAHISAVAFASVGRRVDVGAARQERLDDLDVAGARRDHQRRQAARLRAVRIGAGAEQLVHHRRAGVLAARASGVTP